MKKYPLMHSLLTTKQLKLINSSYHIFLKFSNENKNKNKISLKIYNEILFKLKGSLYI